MLSCRLNESLRAVQLAVFHQFTVSTKKEKRSKKESKLLLRLGIQFAPIGALNTYKGKRGQEPLALALGYDPPPRSGLYDEKADSYRFTNVQSPEAR